MSQRACAVGGAREDVALGSAENYSSIRLTGSTPTGRVAHPGRTSPASAQAGEPRVIAETIDQLPECC